MSSITLGSKGVIYVMANAAMPGLCKVGATTFDPLERARQLTASTSSPTPFHCVYFRHVSDVAEAEKRAHEALADRRVNNRREFFACSVYEACVTIDRVAGGMSELVRQVPTPFADLFSTFPEGDGSGRELTEDEARQCRELKARL